ncbi:MAG: hypothetical protein IPL61_37920 [Myxococcales bacterium]|nr:hypothetical protein [Myxococcales bacterium]
MKALHLLGLAALGLGLTACQDQGLTREVAIAVPESVPADTLTYTVTDAVDQGDVVRYQVVTSTGEVRHLRYGEHGLIDVAAADGEVIAAHNLATGSAVDRLLGKLELWADPVVGYAALGFDNPLPRPAEAPDAVTPELESAYNTGCTRTSLGTWQSGGCTQGGFIDQCGDTTYLLYYQKSSGCFLGFFCDCDAISGAIEF